MPQRDYVVVIKVLGHADDRIRARSPNTLHSKQYYTLETSRGKECKNHFEKL